MDAKDFIVTTNAEIEARENCIQAVDKCVAEATEQCKEKKREEVNVFSMAAKSTSSLMELLVSFGDK